MRILWTLFKVIIGLAIAIPLGIVVLVVSLGILGTLLGLAVLALKLAFLAFIGYGLFRVARSFFAPAPSPKTQAVRELTAPDRYYEAAMRELDAEMGSAPSR
jgi:Na+-transporting methylmalonyl-CoA/oxaloacetate decarboxylase gamma subunit